MVNYRILWIEEDANMIMGLMRPLLREGYQIDTALDFEKAKKRINEKEYNLIILDIILPSGKELRSMEDFKNIENFYGLKFLESIPTDSPPVLVLSVVTDKETIEQIRSFPQVKDVILKGMIRPSQLKEKAIEIIEENPRKVKE